MVQVSIGLFDVSASSVQDPRNVGDRGQRVIAWGEKAVELRLKLVTLSLWLGEWTSVDEGRHWVAGYVGPGQS